RDVSLAARLGSAGEQSVSDAWPVAAARVCEALAATGTGTGQRH
ncbi:glycosyl transferase family 1, partial [Mycobacterium sp. ITM-2017-0098]